MKPKYVYVVMSKDDFKRPIGVATTHKIAEKMVKRLVRMTNAMGKELFKLGLAPYAFKGRPTDYILYMVEMEDK